MKFFLSLGLIVSVGLTSCGKEEEGDGVAVFDFTLTEIQNGAAPTTLTPATSLRLAATSQQTKVVSTVQERMFTGQAGNTIPNALATFDARLQEINQRAIGFGENPAACLSATPVDASISLPNGTTFAMKLQCHDEFNDSGFMIFGRNGDTWYLYERVGALIAAVSVAPSGTGKRFDAFFSMTGDDGVTASIMELKSDQTAQTVAASAVSGTICGIRMAADASQVHISGSVEPHDGTSNSCAEETTIAVSAADMATEVTYDATRLSGVTAMARAAEGSREAHPAGGSVLLIKGATAAASALDSNFGPEAVGELGTTKFQSSE